MASLDDFYRGGPEAFPPACLRTHWDPTMVVAHVLPDFHMAAPQTYDPRPAVRNCFFYNTGAPGGGGPAPHPAEPAQGLPPTPPQFLGGPHRPEPSVGSGVFPPGGAPFAGIGEGASDRPAFSRPGGAASRGFPYSGFKPAVETDLLRIDEAATKCAEKRYVPPHGMPLPSVSGNAVPGSVQPRVPVAPYSECRREDDAVAWARSSRLFFNPTRYDRTTMTPPGLYRPPSINAVREPPSN